MSEKCWKFLKWFLLIGTFLAAVKLIVVDYSMDEEYQIVMAYRRIKGDVLFKTMWEPHQTSAFACYFLMRIYGLFVKNFDGVVVYLRVVTTLIQALLSFWLYLSVKSRTDKKYAFLLSLIYFNFVPKLIQIPEFSNLQLWFFTVCVLLLIKEDKKAYHFILAGIGMSLEVLSYPSTLILFPIFIVCILFSEKAKKKLSGVLIFAGTCISCGIAWTAYIISGVGFNDFFRNLKLILSFDSTHNLNVSDQADNKFTAMAGQFGETFLLLLAVTLLSVISYYLVKAVSKKKSTVTIPLTVYMLFYSAVVQLIFWTVLQSGYERPQIILIVCLLLPIIRLIVSLKNKSFKVCLNTYILPYLPALLGTYGVILAVLYMSDLGLWNSLATGILGAIFSLLPEINRIDEKTRAGKSISKLVLILLISLTAVFAFGKGFTVKLGKFPTNTILGVSNITKKGPAEFIFSHYMQSYILNSDYEDFKTYIAPGSKVLIVNTMTEGVGTTPYMYNDYEICHFSIVDPTTFDEKLLTYWELYPEKYPEVIVVDCWYNNLCISPDSWIMQYIENDFGYSEAIDGKYVRFYIK